MQTIVSHLFHRGSREILFPAKYQKKLKRSIFFCQKHCKLISFHLTTFVVRSVMNRCSERKFHICGQFVVWIRSFRGLHVSYVGKSKIIHKITPSNKHKSQLLIEVNAMVYWLYTLFHCMYKCTKQSQVSLWLHQI